MKALAAVSMWDLCMEKGSGDLDQFQKVNRLISDQLFSNFVSDTVLSHAGGTPMGPSLGACCRWAALGRLQGG